MRSGSDQGVNGILGHRAVQPGPAHTLSRTDLMLQLLSAWSLGHVHSVLIAMHSADTRGQSSLLLHSHLADERRIEETVVEVWMS